MQGVYMLHFDREIKGYSKYQLYGDKRHYIGCSTDIDHRVKQHLAGEGSKMTQHALSQGIEMRLAAIYPVGLVRTEQALTRAGASKLCPICVREQFKEPSKPKPAKGLTVRRLKQSSTCVLCFKRLRAGTAVVITGVGPECYHHQYEGMTEITA